MIHSQLEVCLGGLESGCCKQHSIWPQNQLSVHLTALLGGRWDGGVVAMQHNLDQHKGLEQYHLLFSEIGLGVDAAYWGFRVVCLRKMWGFGGVGFNCRCTRLHFGCT